MNIDKAIDIKTRTGEEFLKTDPDEIEEADRLSIEALKNLKRARSLVSRSSYRLLPGETEE